MVGTSETTLIVLRGNSGSGKTTLARALQRQRGAEERGGYETGELNRAMGKKPAKVACRHDACNRENREERSDGSLRVPGSHFCASTHVDLAIWYASIWPLLTH